MKCYRQSLCIDDIKSQNICNVDKCKYITNVNMRTINAIEMTYKQGNSGSVTIVN